MTRGRRSAGAIPSLSASCPRKFTYSGPLVVWLPLAMGKGGNTISLGSLSRKRLKVGSSSPKDKQNSPSRIARFLSAFDFSPKKPKPSRDATPMLPPIPFSLGPGSIGTEHELTSKFSAATLECRPSSSTPEHVASPTSPGAPHTPSPPNTARVKMPRATVEDADEDEQEEEVQEDSTRHKVRCSNSWPCPRFDSDCSPPSAWPNLSTATPKRPSKHGTLEMLRHLTAPNAPLVNTLSRRQQS